MLPIMGATMVMGFIIVAMGAINALGFIIVAMGVISALGFIIVAMGAINALGFIIVAMGVISALGFIIVVMGAIMVSGFIIVSQGYWAWAAEMIRASAIMGRAWVFMASPLGLVPHHTRSSIQPQLTSLLSWLFYAAFIDRHLRLPA